MGLGVDVLRDLCPLINLSPSLPPFPSPRLRFSSTRRFVVLLLVLLADIPLTFRTTITEWVTLALLMEWISTVITLPTTSTTSLQTLPE